jgi:hypothetical protein
MIKYLSSLFLYFDHLFFFDYLENFNKIFYSILPKISCSTGDHVYSTCALIIDACDMKLIDNHSERLMIRTAIILGNDKVNGHLRIYLSFISYNTQAVQ